MTLPSPAPEAGPSGLAPNDAARDDAARDAEKLVAALIALSPYRAVLQPLLPDIARIARGNRQIRTALAAVEQRADFSRTQRLRRADLGPDKGTLFTFLEYIRFASPDFLGSVGEWPMGDRRG